MKPTLLAATIALAVTGFVGVAYGLPQPFPVVLVIDGPATAISRQEITYTVHYRLTNTSVIPRASFVFAFSEHLTYVSAHVISGNQGVLREPQDGRHGEWSGLGSPEEPEGEVAFTVRTDSDFVGTVGAGLLILGTETANPESHTSTETQVAAAGTLPQTGYTSPASRHGLFTLDASLAIAGISSVLVGLAIRRSLPGSL